MDPVLVTGASGFLARRVIVCLLGEGMPVIGLARSPDPDLAAAARPFLADIRDPSAVMEAVARSSFVIHLAALVGNAACEADSEGAVSVNVGGTLNVLDAVRFFDRPALFASVGNAEDNNLYAITKSTAERFCLMYNQEFGTRVLPIRIFNSYGPWQSWRSGKLIARNLHSALRGEDLTLFGDGEQQDDYVFVDDVAALLVHQVKASQAEEPPSLAPRSIGTGIGTSVKVVLETILKITNTRSEIVRHPGRAGGVVRKNVPEADVLIRPDGFEFTSLEDGLQKTCAALRVEMGL